MPRISIRHDVWLAVRRPARRPVRAPAFGIAAVVADRDALSRAIRSRTQSALWFPPAMVDDALSGLRRAAYRRALAPGEERQLVVGSGGEEPTVAALDHRHRRAAILGQPLQVHPATQRDADERVAGRVKLSRANAGRPKRGAPVILRPLALINRPAVLRVDENESVGVGVPVLRGLGEGVARVVGCGPCRGCGVGCMTNSV